MYTSTINIKRNRHAEIHWGVHKETGELIWIDDVEANGFACNCKCACCGTDLKACTEGKIQQHHFKHRANNDCYYSDEIAEYLKAQEILSTLSTIHVPPVGIRIGRRGDTVIPTSESELHNVFCSHDANHYPPLLTAEIGGQVTRLILSFDGYYVKSDYAKFVQEAHRNTWNCLEIILPHLNEGVSITREYLYNYSSGMNANKRWLYHTGATEAYAQLRQNATALSPIQINYGNISHREYACPLHKREYHDKFYARESDCTCCDFNLAISSDCLCLAEAHVKSLTDLETPVEERKAQFLVLQKTNEDAIAKQRSAKKGSLPAPNTTAFDSHHLPGYNDISNRNPNCNTPVFDHTGLRWHWCEVCQSWIPENNMAFRLYSYGPVKGICKPCHRKRIQSKL